MSGSTDWIEWAGGEQPVSDEKRIEYQLENGAKCPWQFASQLDWRHLGAWNDIIAYRVVQS